MLNFWSQFEEAWRDTLVHKATGRAFERIARLYGFPWPAAEVTEPAWRGALHVEALGLRGTLSATYWALEAALSDYNEVFSGLGGAGDYLFSSTPGTFTARHVNRLVRTKFGLFWTVGPEPFGDGSTIEFSPYACTYWDACPAGEFALGEIQFLPFVLLERTPGPIDDTDVSHAGDACRVEVVFYDQAVPRFNATYLQTPNYVVTAVFGSDTIVFPEAHGLGVGDQIEFTVSGGALAAPLVAGTIYFVQSVPTPTTLTLSATDGGAVINLTTNGTGTQTAGMYTPATMPYNGHLLTNELVDGNPSGTGPYPVYLYDGALFEGVLTALDRTLAAGVTPVVGWYPLLRHTAWTPWDLLPPWL